jgi:hypothetical protein
MFCQSCGSQVTGPFCTKCGARTGASPAAPAGAPQPSSYTPPPPPPPQYAPPPPQYSQPLPPPSSSGSGLKILFVVLGILGLMGVMFVAALMYGWHRVKQTAAAKGVDLNSFTETQRGPVRRLDACALLTKDELSHILNLPIERIEGGGRSSSSSCRYYSEEAAQRGADEAEQAMKKLQEASKSGNQSPDAAENLKNVQNIIKGITSTAGGAQGGPMLSVEVHTENAKAVMASFKLAMGLASGAMAGADEKTQKIMREEVKGIGDEAMFGPMLSLFMFRQGDAAVQIDARTLPGGRDTILAIAKTISTKL